MATIDWQAALEYHDRWLRTVVLSRVGERAAVDDVMQEVALAAIRQKRNLADANQVAPWLYRVAVVQSLLYRRKQGRRRKLTERYADAAPPVEHCRREPEPLAWLLADERQRLTREALVRLSPRDREILLLKYTESWSYQQLSDRLGITETAVEARLHRARGRLRRELAAQELEIQR